MSLEIFGKTWWGKQWLKALTEIDFANRLDRGYSYAKNGRISSIKINQNIVQAKVKGREAKPYQISIVVPPFLESEKMTIIELAKKDNYLLSKLLNRELPEEFLKLLSLKNIKLFPEKWNDLKLNCSCPDWAVPCKHLAAVIYCLANEIDQNPFILLKFKQLDLLAELAKFKIDLTELNNEKIMDFETLKLSKPIPLIQNKDSFTNLDYSKIDDLQQVLPKLFLNNTLFYSQDFKIQIVDVYKKISQVKFFEKLKETPDDFNENQKDLRFYPFQCCLFENGDFDFIVIQDSITTKISFVSLLTLLAFTEKKHLENYHPTFIYLYEFILFVNILLEKAAILPRLFNYQKNFYAIHWLPALINESVKSVFDVLAGNLSDNLIIFKKTTKSTKTYKLHANESLQMLGTIFINYAVSLASEKMTLKSSLSFTDIKINHLFFKNKIENFKEFNELEIPNSIQLWLKRFFVNQSDIVPCICVDELISLKEKQPKFSVEITIKKQGTQFENFIPLKDFLAVESMVGQMDLHKTLHLLTEYFPDLKKVVQTNGHEKLIYNSKTFSQVLTEVLPALELFGIKAILPKSLQKILKPKVSLLLSSATAHNKFFSFDELINFKWKIAVGNHFISPEEFLKLSSETSGLVRIKETYTLMDEATVKQIIYRLEHLPTLNNIDLIQAAMSEEFDDAKVALDDTLRHKIKMFLKLDTIELPKNLKANLRPYQHRGFSWLYKNTQLGLGSVLADDMGLGKTLQVITSILKFKEEGKLKKQPVLIILPQSLITNWSKEVEKFAPSLSVFVYHGTGRQLVNNHVDIVLTTYGVARIDQEKLNKIKWFAVVVDEAQNIKNPLVAQTKAIKKIKSKIKIALSGTPVENRLREYWSIIDFVNHGYLKTLHWFEDNFAKPIEVNQDKTVLNKFKKLTEPFIMRRLKTDKTIIQDLPEKITTNQYCSLTKEQAALYKNVTEYIMQEVQNPNGIVTQVAILKLLIKLKQVCNHPSQYLKQNLSTPESSGKVMLLFQLLETIYENNEKVIIFTQFKEMALILQKLIKNFLGKTSLLLHGSCTRSQRDEMVTQFQNNKRYDTFILSLKAGGTGLNLTAANNVIHFDLWWNPAVENQATDRAFRIGQLKNVIVHRLICKGTLEEKIDTLLIKKQKLANMTVSSGEKWIGDLNSAELQNLIQLDKF